MQPIKFSVKHIHRWDGGQPQLHLLIRNSRSTGCCESVSHSVWLRYVELASKLKMIIKFFRVAPLTLALDNNRNLRGRLLRVLMLLRTSTPLGTRGCLQHRSLAQRSPLAPGVGPLPGPCLIAWSVALLWRRFWFRIVSMLHVFGCFWWWSHQSIR